MAYPVDWFTEESQHTITTKGLTCFYCKFVLRNAVQVICGTRFCEDCLNGLFVDRTSGLTMCPYCEHDENAEDPLHLAPNEYQADNFCRNQVKRLTVRCKYHIVGCTWNGKIVELEIHLQTCSFNFPKHCECGEEFSNALELRNHLESGCPEGAVAPTPSLPCAACGFGEIESPEHIDRICSDIKSLQSNIAVLPKRKVKNAVQMSSAPVVTPTDVPAGPVSTETTRPGQYEALLNKHKANTSLITVLFNEVKTCSHKLMSMESEDENAHVEGVKQTVVMLESVARDMQSKVPAMERQFQDAGVQNTSSRLTWRIDNVSQRMEEARTGTIPALYSQPFFTDDAGYKMCARLYLNGDGIGKDSHMSLFFVLMKGRFDAILSWPFTHRVTMLLLDQSGDGNHVQEKFRPDPNSSSFQRPRSEMNIATGCPRFISKNDLERHKTLYTRENTMFIQIIVE